MSKNQASIKLMITCEHACNILPSFAEGLIPQDVVNTHRGFDIGARIIYNKLVKRFKPDFCCKSQYSRLVIDLNRSLWNKSLFSEFYKEDAQHTSEMIADIKSKALDYWHSYRDPIEEFVRSNLNENDPLDTKSQIIHLAIHSFTPELNGVVRNADIGILYDPTRAADQAYANVIIDEIRQGHSSFNVRRNYPYQGKTDGLCTALRKKYDPQKTGRYVGFEIEINQKLLGQNRERDYR